MREIIKQYELSNEISIYKLEKSGFIRKEPTEEDQLLRYSYIKPLLEDINLYIDIQITSDKKFIFDDNKTVELIDEDFGQPYGAFYNEDKDFPFLNDLIKKYNKTMDELVEKGILKEKVLEQENKPKVLTNLFLKNK